MTGIKRYRQIGAYNELECLPEGELCRWSDVEKLQQELNEVRAKALTAVWLLPDHTSLVDLARLTEEAREVFLGKDKQTIAKLQDELHNARLSHQQAIRAIREGPGVNAVYGTRLSGRAVDTRHVLMITALSRAPNGGLEIEVQLP